MKIKSLITVLIIICMVSVMVSCKQNTNGTDAPVPTDGTPVPSEDESAQQKLTIPVDPDFFLLCCENSDFVIDFSASSARQVCYQLISAFPIASERECSISFDKEVSYTVEISDMYETAIADDISLLTYAGKDWAEIAAELAQCGSASEADALINKKGINSVPKADDTVKLYSTFVLISFNECAEDVELNSLTITVNGISKTYDIGSIRLTKGGPRDSNAALLVDSLCLCDVQAAICKGGFVSSFDIGADINDEVVFTGVTLSTQSAEITETLVRITKADGMTMTQRFTPDMTISLEKGDRIDLDLRIQYNADNSRGIANGQYIIYVNFEADGKDEWDFAEIVYRARFGGIFQYYVSSELGLDIASYWADYVPALAAWHE